MLHKWLSWLRIFQLKRLIPCHRIEPLGSETFNGLLDQLCDDTTNRLQTENSHGKNMWDETILLDTFQCFNRRPIGSWSDGRWSSLGFFRACWKFKHFFLSMTASSISCHHFPHVSGCHRSMWFHCRSALTLCSWPDGDPFSRDVIVVYFRFPKWIDIRHAWINRGQ